MFFQTLVQTSMKYYKLICCFFLESEPAPVSREQRKRKPTKKYSSSDYSTEDSWEETEVLDSEKNQKASLTSCHSSDIQLESELSQKVEIIMATDIETFPFRGFDDVNADNETRTMYEMHICDMENASETTFSDSECRISDSCIPENFYEQNDFVYLSGLNDKTKIPIEWRGAKKVATLLRKKFGGNPTVVHPLPRWLSLKVIYLKVWLKKYKVKNE